MSDEQQASEVFSEAEQAAMKERARESKAEARSSRKRADGERAVLEKIAEMPEPDRAMAERVHAIVTATAPELWPRTWYGMPAYSVGGKTVVCFFQGAAKFESRYATIGFNDAAALDDGSMWPVSFAITEPDEANEQRISELVRGAVG